MGAGLVTALQARASSFSLIARTGSATAVQHVESQVGQTKSGRCPSLFRGVAATSEMPGK